MLCLKQTKVDKGGYLYSQCSFMDITYNGRFCVSVFGNRFEEFRNTFMMKLSEKYEVHLCIRIKDLELSFINTAKPFQRKIRKCFP